MCYEKEKVYKKEGTTDIGNDLIFWISHRPTRYAQFAEGWMRVALSHPVLSGDCKVG